MTEALVRPLLPDDVPAVVRVQHAAFARLDGDPTPLAPEVEVRAQARVAHLQRTDPDGAWVVEEAGTVVGAGLALRREQVWFLSLLVVDPDRQGRGAGARLLEACLRTADGARGSYLCSSQDPRALRRYVRAGFALRPGLDARGPVDRSLLRPAPGVREGDWARDGDRLDDVGRALRGAPYGPDLQVLAQHRLLVARGGAAVVREGRVVLVGAEDPGTAALLLRAALAEAGPEVEVDAVTGDQPWAVQELVAAGLPLRPGTSVCVRGDVGPLAPYLPGGAYG